MAGAALVLGVLLWLLLRWWRRRARRRPAAESPVEQANDELQVIDRLGLIEAGELGRYLALLAEVVRVYIVRRVPSAKLSATTHEMLAGLAADGRVPIERLRGFLTEADLVKFARATPTAERARLLGVVARELVTEIDAAINAADAARREAALRQESEELEARRAARARGTGGRAA
jgi:hypothetical protein